MAVVLIIAIVAMMTMPLLYEQIADREVELLPEDLLRMLILFVNKPCIWVSPCILSQMLKVDEMLDGLFKVDA